ncbi:MAG: mandelate racemase/muconate lactonizing enzyme family protein [Planctomycetota bacterium]|jgi:muconate cycloisomerase
MGHSITDFEILTVEIPMRFAVQHGLIERRVARNILVAARDAEGRCGWGESCPRSEVTGETLDSVRSELQENILPALHRRSCSSMNSMAEVASCAEAMLDGLRRNQHAAFCAAELALLDLAGQWFGESAGSVLGPVRSLEVQYSGVIATADPEAARKQAASLAELGAGAVKVKVGEDLDTNRQLLESARKILGDEVELRIDAKCAWSASEAIAQLQVLRDFMLAGVEQPVAADDLAAMAEVTAADLVQVVADESICSFEDAQRLIDNRACNVFNLQLSKCGGLVNCGRLHSLAFRAGVSCQLGAQMGETGILSAAGRQVATRLDSLLWQEGSFGRLLLETDITAPDVTVGPGGWAPALDSPGLGVAPVTRALERHTVDKVQV